MRRGGTMAAVLAVVASAATVHGKDLEIASAWAAAPVPVDGSAQGWAELLRPLGDPPVVVGLQNDGRFLYLCVKTSDPILKRELAHAGLTVWVNGEGKDVQRFGVRYPAGFGGPRERQAPPDGEQPPRERAGRPVRALEILGPGADDRQRVQPGPDDPVQAAIGDDSGVMVLEYRVPLAAVAGHALAVGAGPGATVALGLATERPKFKGGERARFGGRHWGGGGPEGGFERGRGGYGGPEGQGEGGPGGRGDGGADAGREGAEGGARDAAVPMPIDVWLRVTLAKAPAPPAAH